MDEDDYPKHIHNFRNAALYPQHGDDMRRWAWEFLRRNAQYQRIWDLFNRSADTDKNDRPNGKWKRGVVRGRFFVDHHHYADPPPRPEETLEDYEKRNENGRVVVFSTFIEETFKIHPEPIDWRKDTLDDEYPVFTSVFSNDNPAPWRLTGEISFEPELIVEKLNDLLKDVGDNLYTFAFDASKPAGPQLDDVKVWLNRKQAKNRQSGEKLQMAPRLHVAHAQRYLRILDAMAIGESTDDIKKHLDLEGVDNLKGFNQAKTKAIELRDRTYWQIAS